MTQNTAILTLAHPNTRADYVADRGDAVAVFILNRHRFDSHHPVMCGYIVVFREQIDLLPADDYAEDEDGFPVASAEPERKYRYEVYGYRVWQNVKESHHGFKCATVRQACSTIVSQINRELMFMCGAEAREFELVLNEEASADVFNSLDPTWSV